MLLQNLKFRPPLRSVCTMGRPSRLSIAVLTLFSFARARAASIASRPTAVVDGSSGEQHRPQFHFAGWTKLKQDLAQAFDPSKGPTSYRDGSHEMAPNWSMRPDGLGGARGLGSSESPRRVRDQINEMKDDLNQKLNEIDQRLQRSPSSVGGAGTIGLGMVGAIVLLSTGALKAMAEAWEEHSAARPIAKEQLQLTQALRVLIEKLRGILSLVYWWCLFKLVMIPLAAITQ
jgi:hypothetical protein